MIEINDAWLHSHSLSLLKDIYYNGSLKPVDVVPYKLKNCYDVEMTLDDVGSFFKVSKERIRQIEAKALRKLKHPSRARFLKSFFNEQPFGRVDNSRGLAPLPDLLLAKLQKQNVLYEDK